MGYELNMSPTQTLADNVTFLRAWKNGHEVLVPYSKILTGGVLSRVFFYSENKDVTDELQLFLRNLRGRLADEFGGNNNLAASLAVNFLGRQYDLSETIDLDKEYAGLVLEDGALQATNSVAWTTALTPMINIHGASGGGAKISCVGMRNFKLEANRYVDYGVLVDNTNQTILDHVEVNHQKLCGFKIITSNRAIEIIGCRAQEWGNGEATGKDYPSRTSSGIEIEKSDGFAVGCVFPINKVGMKFDNIRNFAIDRCHPWMGDMNNEADRFNAWTIDIGNIDPSEPGASGLQIDTCYIDHGPIRMTDSFAHQLTNCSWTGGETGIYPVVLVATVANTNLSGLKTANSRISSDHNAAFFDFRTSGAGSYSQRLLHQHGIVSQGSTQILDQKLGSSLWVLDDGTNGKDGGTFDSQTRIQSSDRAVSVKVADRYGAFASHSVYKGGGLIASRWAGNAYPLIHYSAFSRSSTIGVYGGYPLDGDVLGGIGGMGDNGTSFGSGLAAPGAQIRFCADADWTSIAQATKIQFGITLKNTTGNCTFVWAFTNDGDLVPEVDNAYSLGSPGHPMKKVTTYLPVLKQVGSVPAALTNSLVLYWDGTNFKAKKPDNSIVTIF